MLDKKKITSLLSSGNFTDAYNVLDQFISDEKKIEDLILQHKVIKYWLNREDKLKRIQNPYETGIAYLDEWKDFEMYSERQSIASIPEIDAIHYFVFSKALEYFLDARKEKRINDIDLLIKIAYCFNQLGNFNDAIQTLQYAYRLNKSQLIVACIADNFYLKGEEIKAKLLFKDLFFMENTIHIDMDYLSCDKLHTTIAQLQKAGFKEHELFDWFPVYGYLNGFLNVQRELLSTELSAITADISKFEKMFYTSKNLKAQIEPKLLKKYVLMLEYYKYQSSDYSKFQQYETKIKNINDSVGFSLLEMLK